MLLASSVNFKLQNKMFLCMQRNILLLLGLVSLFNGISTFAGYLLPKPSCKITVVVLSNPYPREDKEIHIFP